MTREEAKEVFINKGYVKVKGGIIFDGDKWRQSVEVITEWLKQQPCEDAISRPDAIRVASGYCHWSNIPKELAKLPSVNPIPCEDAISRQTLKDLGAECIAKRDENGNLIPLGSIDSLPSVSTEKTGRWIDTGSGQECSNCHEIQHGYDNHRLYCANCGSRMTGVEE